MHADGSVIHLRPIYKDRVLPRLTRAGRSEGGRRIGERQFTETFSALRAGAREVRHSSRLGHASEGGKRFLAGGAARRLVNPRSSPSIGGKVNHPLCGLSVLSVSVVRTRSISF